MKKILVLSFACLALAGCDRIPQKIGETVREVEVGDTRVDEDYDEETSELHVTITDVESGNSWDVNLGEECRQYPLPKGERFLTRFDRSAAKADPKTVYLAPQTSTVYKYLCA